MERSADIDGLVARMEALLVQLRERGDGNRHFLATYLRTTRAVRDELAAEPGATGRLRGLPGAAAELERLAAARVADLVAPGQVVLKLAVQGFGVRLPAAPG